MEAFCSRAQPQGFPILAGLRNLRITDCHEPMTGSGKIPVSLAWALRPLRTRESAAGGRDEDDDGGAPPQFAWKGGSCDLWLRQAHRWAVLSVRRGVGRGWRASTTRMVPFGTLTIVQPPFETPGELAPPSPKVGCSMARTCSLRARGAGRGLRALVCAHQSALGCSCSRGKRREGSRLEHDISLPLLDVGRD